MRLFIWSLTLCFAFAEDFTVFEFTRLINTCDVEGDVEIGPAGTSRVVWSYNDEDPISEDDIQYHQARGSRSVNLLGQPAEPIPLEPDIQNLDLLVDEVPVESAADPGTPVDTLYFCKVFELPQDTKRHVVRAEPLLQPENLQYVHHILIYQCPEELPDHLHNFERDCYLPDNPPEIYGCMGNTLLVAWAVGGGVWNTPLNAGYPIGDGYGKHVVMEIHYDNPFERSIVDSSGFRLWFTPTLREVDAGILMLGRSTRSILIPPKEEAFDIKGECHKGCTEKMFPEGANAFGVFLHAHLLGRQINLQHIRDGIELPNIENNENYDFNFQETVALTPELEIQPGDEFLLTCTYNSMDKDEPTYGGESSRDEMCLAFVSYYPMSPLRNCVTFEDNDQTYGTCGGLQPQPVEPIDFIPLPVIDPCEGFEPGDYDIIPRIGDTFDPSRYPHQMILDGDDKYTMHWNFEHDKNLLHFAVEVQTEGWVGFGISPNGDMVGADVYIAWIDRDGNAYFRDRYAAGRVLPAIDASQDVFDITGYEYSREFDIVGDPVGDEKTVGDGSSSNSLAVMYVILALLLSGGFIAGVVYFKRRSKGMQRNNSKLIELNTRGGYSTV